MSCYFKLIGFITLFFYLSCCAKKEINIGENIEILKTISIKNNKEEVKLFPNKQLNVFKRNESLVYDFQINRTSDVIYFSYEEDVDKAVYDGGYREELIFEIPKGDFDLSLSGSELQRTKMIFGRHCFCRGQNGLFTIEDGRLEISRKRGKIKIDLNFYQSKVPQIIKNIYL